MIAAMLLCAVTEAGTLDSLITLTLACGSYIQSCSGEDFDEPWQGTELKTRTGRTRSTLEGPVIFPTTSMIAGSQEILSRMSDSWDQTLASCTSTKRREYGFRNTGPTDVDVAAANQKQIPGFLYDYEAPVIHGGDSKNAPKKLYTYGQYSQRPPMN